MIGQHARRPGPFASRPAALDTLLTQRSVGDALAWLTHGREAWGRADAELAEDATAQEGDAAEPQEGATDAQDPVEATSPATAPETAPATPAQRTPRANTKQARMIAMLEASEGATTAEIAEATGWQHRTVRGAFAGAPKKKLGLAIASEKVEGRGRVYRIAG